MCTHSQAYTVYTWLKYSRYFTMQVSGDLHFLGDSDGDTKTGRLPGVQQAQKVAEEVDHL